MTRLQGDWDVPTGTILVYVNLAVSPMTRLQGDWDLVHALLALVPYLLFHQWPDFKGIETTIFDSVYVFIVEFFSFTNDPTSRGLRPRFGSSSCPKISSSFTNDPTSRGLRLKSGLWSWTRLEFHQWPDFKGIETAPMQDIVAFLSFTNDPTSRGLRPLLSPKISNFLSSVSPMTRLQGDWDC